MSGIFIGPRNGQAVASPGAGNQRTAGRNTSSPVSEMPVQDDIARGSMAIGAVGDLLGPLPAGDNADVGELKHEGPVWWVGLTEPQTNALEAVLGAGGQGLALAGGPLWPVISAALAASLAYIKFVDKLGGNNGVDINGVAGTAGVIVTPRLGGIYGDLLQAARVAVSGRTILDFVVRASGIVPGLGAALDVPVAASVFQAVEAGTPLGWAIAGAVGLVVDLLGSAPDPNAHGAVVADRDQAQGWESFLMGSLGDTQHFSLLSWQGFFQPNRAAATASMPIGRKSESGKPGLSSTISTGPSVSRRSTASSSPRRAAVAGNAMPTARPSEPGRNSISIICRAAKVALRTLDHNKFVSVQQNS